MLTALVNACGFDVNILPKQKPAVYLRVKIVQATLVKQLNNFAVTEMLAIQSGNT